MFNNNFHVYVLCSTLFYYMILRLYKQDILSNQRRRKKSSNLIYLTVVPSFLYLTFYLFIESHDSDTILTSIQPSSN